MTFLNLRFMRKHWPESRAFATLSAELTRRQRLDGKLGHELREPVPGRVEDARGGQ